MLNKLLFAFMGLMAVGAYSETSNWYTDTARAFKVADSLKKPILLYFKGSCAMCNKLEQESFQRLAVMQNLAKYVCVRLDEGRYPSLYKEFNIETVPVVILSDGRGGTVKKMVGFIEPQTLQKKLELFYIKRND
ncbi:MAG: hypothetical protein A2293_12330 [Elusimicrobia bacterium RIFOXYB2_FULL_49_7]|nr:MAG: hypothetical protein A2293_12330 [Elusimicrobia bacterium RIFOXYB2_FULL_49_7]